MSNFNNDCESYRNRHLTKWDNHLDDQYKEGIKIENITENDNKNNNENNNENNDDNYDINMKGYDDNIFDLADSIGIDLETMSKTNTIK